MVRQNIEKRNSLDLHKNQIILASVSNSLSSPNIKSLIDYPNYQAHLRDSRVLWGIDEVELRVLSFDHEKKTLEAVFHASSVLYSLINIIEYKGPTYEYANTN